jgi:hypothetical protein
MFNYFLMLESIFRDLPVNCGMNLEDSFEFISVHFGHITRAIVATISTPGTGAKIT